MPDPPSAGSARRRAQPVADGAVVPHGYRYAGAYRHSLGVDFKAGTVSDPGRFEPKETRIADRLAEDGAMVHSRELSRVDNERNPDCMVRWSPADEGTITEFKTLASDSVFVTRTREDGAAAVGGEVQANDHLSYDVDDPTVLDGYDTVLDVWSPGLEGDELTAEAERLFTAVTGALPWPALLVKGLDLLAAAWSPERGPRRFPAGTTPDPEDRPAWQDYALPPVTPPTG